MVLEVGLLEAVLFHTLSPSKTIFFSAKKINGTHWRKVMILTIYVLFTFFAVFEKKFIILVPKYCPSHKINWSKEKWCEWFEKFIQILKASINCSKWSFGYYILDIFSHKTLLIYSDYTYTLALGYLGNLE